MADGLIVTAATAVTLATLRDAPDWSHHLFSRRGFRAISIRLSTPAPWRRRYRMRLDPLDRRHLPRSASPTPVHRCAPRPPAGDGCLQLAVVLWLGFKTLLLRDDDDRRSPEQPLIAKYLGDRGSPWCPGPPHQWRERGWSWRSPVAGVRSGGGSTVADACSVFRGLPSKS